MKLSTVITQIHQGSRGTYGNPRVHEALKQRGTAVGKKRVERLMRALGLQGRVVQVTRRQPDLRRYREMGENLRLGLPTRAQKAWSKGKCQSVGLQHRQWVYGIVFPYLDSRTNLRSQVSHYDGITLCFEQLH